jgi:hypothetical protein
MHRPPPGLPCFVGREYTHEGHGYNYNLRLCYPRRMVDSSRNGMLFFRQRFFKASAILSGEGLKEEIGEPLQSK